MSGFSFSGLMKMLSFLSFPTSWGRVRKEERERQVFPVSFDGKAGRPHAASGDNGERNVSVSL